MGEMYYAVAEEPLLRLQLPTLAGKVEGIVGLNPYRVQCRDCGLIGRAVDESRGLWALVVMQGWCFHRCEGRSGVRRCPACLQAVQAACGNDGCQWSARRTRSEWVPQWCTSEAGL